MAISVTAESIIASAQRRAFMPASGSALSTSDWLQILNEELESYLYPWILQFAKNYFILSQDVTFVANQADYALPTRSVAARFHSIQLLDPSGNPVSGSLPPLELEDGMGWPITSFQTGYPGSYVVKNNYLHFVPAPSSTAATPSFRCYFHRRANQVVLVSSVIGTITSITTALAAAGNFRINFTGAAPSGFTAGASVELVRSASGFEVDGPFVIASTGSGFLEVTGTIPTTASTSDTCCLQDQANVCTFLPLEFCWQLAQAMAVEGVRDRGDDDKFSRIAAKLESMEKLNRKLLGQRDVAGRHKMINGQTRFGARRPPFYVR